MKALITAFALGLVVLGSMGAVRRAPQPYVGEWSNGRGDTLSIKLNTIRFGSDKAVDYRDITRVTNEQEFDLELTSEGKLNYLTRFIHISTAEGDKPEEFKMTLYDSLKDMRDGGNSVGEATWYRDK